MQEIQEHENISRPKINHWIVATKTVTTILCCFILSQLLGQYTSFSPSIICGTLLLFTTLLFLKYICIWAIKMYQLLAPAEVRLACNFIPSCSEYMILSIRKYGVVKGIYVGRKRMQKCHYPNGGIDYP